MSESTHRSQALLTTGNPARRIIVFALPILAADFLHLFYTMTDAFIVGRWLGINGLAAVGAGTSPIHFILSFAIGLTAGFAVITTQRVGEGNEEGIRRSVATGILLSLVSALILTFLLIPLVPHILSAMRTPAEIIDDAGNYVMITCMGIFFFVFTNMFTGIIHAGGNSLTPFLFMIIATACNIVLDILFIVVFSWGIKGAAAATVISEFSACVLCTAYLLRRLKRFLPRRDDWRSFRKEAGAHLSLGIAMSLQRCIVEAGNILVQAAMNTMGAMTIAAVSAAQRIRGLNMTPFFALSRAMTTYTAQNYGAGKMDRVNRGIFHACLVSLVLGVFMAALNQFSGASIAALFLKDNSEAVALARQYVLFTGYTVFLLGIMLVFRSSLQGLGMRRAPILCGVMETVMSVFAAFVLIPRFGFVGVCLVNPLSWLASCVPLFIAFGIVRKKERGNGIRA